MSGSAARNLLEKVEIARRRFALFGAGDAIVLGISGGPDSMALLHVMASLKRKFKLRLHVAHLHHGLTPGATGAQGLVRSACAGLKLPFHTRRVNVRALSKRHRLTLEEAGRVERYRFFARVAAVAGAKFIMTAHTRDDQAETVLLRLLRGAGLRGLAGIPVKRAEGPFTLIRPMLSVSRAQVLDYLRSEKIPAMSDPSNASDIFTRNRVRRRLLPLLERSFNPAVRSALNSLASVCGHAQDFLDREALKAYRRCRTRTRRPGRVLLKLDRLLRLHPAMRSEVLSRAIVERKGDRKRVSHAHLASASELVGSSSVRATLHLPEGLRFRKNGNYLIVE